MALATLRAGEGAGLVRTVLSIDGPVKWRPPRSVQGLFSFEFLSSKTFCSRCKLLVYCSPICQLEHYNKTHKNHCKYLAGIKVFILNTNTCFVNANTNTTSRSWFLIFNTITTPASRSRRVPSTPRRTVPGYIFNLKALHLHFMRRCISTKRLPVEELMDPLSSIYPCIFGPGGLTGEEKRNKLTGEKP